MMKNEGWKMKAIVLVILLQSVKFNMVVLRGKWTKFIEIIIVPYGQMSIVHINIS